MALEPVGVGAQVELAGLGEAELLAVVRGQPRPEHVAIIMDGNGRWATRRGLPRVAGHRAGAEAVRRTVEAAPGLGVAALTLYAFSADNWKRPAAEVAALMRLLARYLRTETPRLARNHVRLELIGRRDPPPGPLLAAIGAAEHATARSARLHLRLAAGYSSPRA